MIALKPPRDLVKVLLEGKKGPWWWRGAGGGRGSGATFHHVDLFVSGGFSGGCAGGGGDGAGPKERGPGWRREGQRGRRRR